MKSLSKVRLGTPESVVSIRAGSSSPDRASGGSTGGMRNDLPLTEFERSMHELQQAEEDSPLDNILSQLEHNYKSERESIYQSGYNAGVEAGRAEVEKQYQEETQAVGSVVRKLQEERWRLRKDAELSLMHLVVQISERVLNHELETTPSLIENILHEAMAYIQENELLEVTLHPADYTYIEEQSEVLEALPDGVRLKRDASIQRGGCILQTNMETIDARLETKLEQIADQLFMNLPDTEDE